MYLFIFLTNSLSERGLSDWVAYVILQELKNIDVLMALRKLRTRVSCSGLFWRACSKLFGIWNVNCWLVVFGQENGWVIDKFFSGHLGQLSWKDVWCNEVEVADSEPGYYYFFIKRVTIWRKQGDWDGFNFVKFVIYLSWPVWKPHMFDFLVIEVFYICCCEELSIYDYVLR